MREPFDSIYSHGLIRAAVCIPAVRVADPAFNLEETLRLARRAHGRRRSGLPGRVVGHRRGFQRDDATVMAILPRVPPETAVALGTLRRQGFATVDTYDPYVPEHAHRPAGRRCRDLVVGRRRVRRDRARGGPRRARAALDRHRLAARASPLRRA